jgi:predicted MFS family arabinose efflux permease
VTNDLSAGAVESDAGRQGNHVTRLLLGDLSEPLRGNVLRVIAVSFVITVGIGMIFPLLPAFARRLHVSVAEVGVVVSVFGVARLLVDCAGGAVLSRVSERSIATAGAVVLAAGSLLTGVAGTFTVLVVARVLHGIGTAFFIAAGIVYVGREVPAAHRAAALGGLQMAQLVAVGVGPVVGSALSLVGGIRIPFFVAAATGAASGIYALRTFPKRVPERGGATRRVVLDRRLYWTTAVMLVAALVVLGMRQAVRFTLLPLYIDGNLRADPAWSGIILSVMSAAEIAGLAAMSRFADRMGRRWSLTLGLLVTGCLTFLFPLTHSIPHLLAVTLTMGWIGGVVAVVPTAIAADLGGKSAWMMSSNRMAADAGIVVGPALATSVASSHGFGPAFALNGYACLLTACLAFSIVETRRLMGDGQLLPAALDPSTPL